MSELYTKADTAAILGIKGLAESMSELYAEADTAAILGIKGLAEAFASIYGDLDRVILPGYTHASRQLVDELGFDAQSVSEETPVLLFSGCPGRTKPSWRWRPDVGSGG